MPIYEYHCNECSHEFEVMQKINDRPIRKCEKCGRLKAKRMISQTSFILKGSGWYVTDYGAKKPSSNNKNPDSKRGEKSSTNSEKSSESSNDKSSASSDKGSSATDSKAATA
ncbi:MAG: zinc ribbon domain-containing protein [Proteobacteria bacterium]|nr:zinc ribbon domain-containing protein [Pseudomonadota bacterium]